MATTCPTTTNKFDRKDARRTPPLLASSAGDQKPSQRENDITQSPFDETQLLENIKSLKAEIKMLDAFMDEDVFNRLESVEQGLILSQRIHAAAHLATLTLRYHRTFGTPGTLHPEQKDFIIEDVLKAFKPGETQDMFRQQLYEAFS